MGSLCRDLITHYEQIKFINLKLKKNQLNI